MSYHWVLLPNVSPEECLQRGRAALSNAGFGMAEAQRAGQYGTRGDYVALVTCASAQPTVVFVTVSGPRSAEAVPLAQQLREGISNPGAGRPPGAKG